MDRLNGLLADIDALGKEGRDLEMLPIFDQAIHEARLRKDAHLLARILNDYGGVLRNTGRYEQADGVLQEALAIVTEVSGTKSQAYVTTMLNLGTNYLDWKKYNEAKKVFFNAYEVAELLHMDNIAFASLCNNLGTLYCQERDFEQAYRYQKKALAILEYRERSRVKLAIGYSNVAQTCMELGKSSEFSELMTKAEKLLQEAVGERHPLYATVVNNLAAMYYKQGEVDKAKSLLVKALDILKGTFGVNGKGYRTVAANLEYIQSQPSEVKSKVSEVQQFRVGSGLDLSYQFYKNQVRPVLEAQCAHILPRLAGGLMGRGSECFGFDDALSKDHDFETKVLLFLTTRDYQQYHEELEQALGNIPGGAVYIIPIQDYYFKYTKTGEGPKTMEQWRLVPEHFLATASNGVVFFDHLGQFTDIRQRLLSYYPRDIWLKHLAYECLQFAQAGQYNYGRSLARQEFVAASLALQEAMNHGMNIIFILNKVYMPFYKWRHRRLKELPLWGKETAELIEKIAIANVSDKENATRLEVLAKLIVDELRRQGLSQEKDTFLLNHGYEVFSQLQDVTLKQESPWSR